MKEEKNTRQSIVKNITVKNIVLYENSLILYDKSILFYERRYFRAHSEQQGQFESEWGVYIQE